MDQDEEVAKFKWLLFAGIVFLLSGYASYQELNFAVWGATAEASVIRILEKTELGVPVKKSLTVEYTFTDDEGTQHRERDNVPIDWLVPEDKVIVKYLRESNSHPAFKAIRTPSSSGYSSAVWRALDSAFTGSTEKPMNPFAVDARNDKPVCVRGRLLAPFVIPSIRSGTRNGR